MSTAADVMSVKDLIPDETDVRGLSIPELLALAAQCDQLPVSEFGAADCNQRQGVKEICSLMRYAWQQGTDGDAMLNKRNRLISQAFTRGVLTSAESAREISYDLHKPKKGSGLVTAKQLCTSALAADDFCDHVRSDLQSHCGMDILLAAYTEAAKNAEIPWAEVFNSQFSQNEQGSVGTLKVSLDAMDATVLVDLLEDIDYGSPANTMIRYLLDRNDVAAWLNADTVVKLADRRMLNGESTKAERKIVKAAMEHVGGKGAFALVVHQSISPVGTMKLLEEHPDLAQIREVRDSLQ